MKELGKQKENEVLRERVEELEGAKGELEREVGGLRVGSGEDG